MMKATTYTGRLGSIVLGLISLLCIGLLAPVPSHSQEVEPSLEECAGGTLYYFAFPDTVENAQDARFAPKYPEDFLIYIYSPVDQNVRISREGGGQQNFNVAANTVKEFDTREITVPNVTTINTPQLKTLKLESDFPIVVYGYFSSHFGCAAFTAIPVEAWGTEYFSASWEGESVRNIYPAGETNFDAHEKKPAPAQILIIAAYDDTRVTIRPTGVLLQCSSCTSVTLNKGEAYLVESYVDTNDQTERQADIAGTYISANKRIGVLSGNTRTQVEPFSITTLGGNSFKDLTIEWIAPIDQHGTQFVFMPTWDEYHQDAGAAIEREAEFVRVYGTAKGEVVTSSTLDTRGQNVPTNKPQLNEGEFSHERIGAAGRARVYLTSGSAQSYQSPKSIPNFRGTTGSGNFIGAAFDAWGTYMVEDVPREQWTSFSPFKVSSTPTGMKHYLNLVTDTNNQFNVYVKQGTSPRSLFPFNRGRIPGTDLVWGSVSVNPGTDYIIEGLDGARFSGFVYGTWKGYELYRPGAAKDDGDGDGKGDAVAGGGDSDLPEILHPSEYEENIAQMYGFPLAPSRCVLLPPDEYKITKVLDCSEMTITIESKNPNPAGIKFIRLVTDRDSTYNARLEFIEPESALALREKNYGKATVKLVAIDPTKNARAVIEFKDRTREGKVFREVFTYEAERATIDPVDGLKFQNLTINKDSDSGIITITNPLNKDLVIKNLDFALKNQLFRITRVIPNFNYSSGTDSLILKSGQSLKVYINITPVDENGIYQDSLKIKLGCITLTVPLRATTVQPCLQVTDLDFGTLGVGVEATRDINVCNIGEGEVTFNSPYLTWLTTNFTVDQSEIDKLKNLVLKKGDCIKITVKFKADKEGNYNDSSRFWASTRECDDISLWKARVLKPGPTINGHDFKDHWLSSASGCTKNDTLKYFWDIQVANTGESTFRVDSLVLTEDVSTNPVKSFAIDNAGNVTPGKTMAPAVTENVRVSYQPMSEEGPDRAVVTLYYTDVLSGDTGSISDELLGEGIESYLTVTDQSYTRVQFTAPGATTETKTFTITSTGTRAVTISNVSIKGANPLDFKNITFTNPVQTGTPFTLRPGQSQIVEVTFDPQSANPLVKNATLDIEGDFAYANCSRSDSSGTMTGEVYTLGVEAEGFQFNTLLTCYEADGQVLVRNTSTDPVAVTNISQALPANQGFTVGTIPTLPFILNPAGQPGSELVVPVHYAPNAAGTNAATVTFEVKDTTLTTLIGNVISNVTGSARQITLTFSVDDGYSTFPGLPLDIPVMLHAGDGLDNASTAEISDFEFKLQFNDGMMLLMDEATDIQLGSLFPASQGWQFEVKFNGTEPDPTDASKVIRYIVVRIYNSAGQTVKVGKDEGEALKLHFTTYIGDSQLSTFIVPSKAFLNVYGQNSNECVLFEYEPGSAELDSVCGLNFRLIESFATKYSVGQAYPSVASTSTDIEFAIGLDAQTKVELFDQSGNKVGTLVNDYLQPGTYKVTWNVSGYPSGKYFYRIQSGHWSGTQEVIIQK